MQHRPFVRLRNLVAGPAIFAALIAAAMPLPGAAAAQDLPVNQTESEEQRLDRVAYGLRAASSGKCAQPEMLTGFSLHEIGAYEADQRSFLENQFHLGKEFGIRQIVSGSTADRAGFLPGDVITRINGADLAGFGKRLITRRASYDRIASFEQYLGAALAIGPAQLTIRRGDTTQTLMLAGQPGCGGSAVHYARGGLNAWSDGKYVAVTSTMMRFAASDSELAFVIAHEMSHNILKHADRLRGKSRLLASIGIGSGKIKATEVEADQMAAGIMLAAGFPIDGAVSLLKRAGGGIPLNFATTHPGIGRRIRIVSAAAQDYTLTLQAARIPDLPALRVQLTDLASQARAISGADLLASAAPATGSADLLAANMLDGNTGA